MKAYDTKIIETKVIFTVLTRVSRGGYFIGMHTTNAKLYVREAVRVDLE